MIGVFGANGFIGRHLVRRLARRGRPFRAVSRRFEAAFAAELPPHVELVEADLREPLGMASALQDLRTVVQLISASTPGLKNDNIIADLEENVLPHVAFLQMCVTAGVERFVFVSSGGTVYGPGAPIPTPETCPTEPISSHGLTKLVVEKYIGMHGRLYGLDHVILRAANPFGPGQVYRRGQGLIPALLERWQRGQPVRVYGNGRSMRDYIYIDDMTDALEAALDLPGQPRLVLNIGCGESRSVMDVIRALEAVLGGRFEIEYVGARVTDVDTVCLDPSRAQEVLGWRRRVPFEDGISKTVRAWRGTAAPSQKSPESSSG